jgi:hypothetical protein
MIFGQGFFPPDLDTPVSNCKAAVLVLARPDVLFLHYPPYLVSIPLSATMGGARWKTSNSSRKENYIIVKWAQENVKKLYSLLNKYINNVM